MKMRRGVTLCAPVTRSTASWAGLDEVGRPGRTQGDAPTLKEQDERVWSSDARQLILNRAG